MNWNLKDHKGFFITGINHDTIEKVEQPTPLTQALRFHGTRDYIDGVIFALELLGHERFYPLMTEDDAR